MREEPATAAQPEAAPTARAELSADILGDHAAIVRGLGDTELALRKAYAGYPWIEWKREQLHREPQWHALAVQPAVRAVYALYCDLLSTGGHWESAFDVVELDRATTLLAFAAAVRDSAPLPAASRYRASSARLERIAGDLSVRESEAGNHVAALLDQHASALAALEHAELEAVEHRAPPSESVPSETGSSPRRARRDAAGWCVARGLSSIGAIAAHLGTHPRGTGRTCARGGRARSARVPASALVTRLEEGAEAPCDAQALAELLLAPLSAALERAERVIFVSAGALVLAPLHLLPWRGGPLALQKCVSYLPAATLAAARDWSLGSARGSVLVVGDPQKMSLTRLETARQEQLPSFPASLIEAHVVAALHDTTAFVGALATEAAVLERLASQPRLLHFATHGYFSSLSPLASGIVLANGDIISTDEIAGLRVASALVVLTACDLAKGQVRGSEVIGLARSLLVASMVVSWTERVV